MTVDIKIKKMFFDRKKVIRAVKSAKRKALSKAGAFIRTSARSSIRKRKNPAPPGQPPSAHTGQIRRILFGYDQAAESVVIGPVRLKAKSDDTPHRLEFGGTETLKKSKVIGIGGTRRGVGGKFVNAKRVRVAKGTKLRYQVRPFMAPALKKNAKLIGPQFEGSIVGP